jgi:hypothetical protein
MNNPATGASQTVTPPRIEPERQLEPHALDPGSGMMTHNPAGSPTAPVPNTGGRLHRDRLLTGIVQTRGRRVAGSTPLFLAQGKHLGSFVNLSLTTS